MWRATPCYIARDRRVNERAGGVAISGGNDISDAYQEWRPWWDQGDGVEAAAQRDVTRNFILPVQQLVASAVGYT
jgi:hypothetical protein